MAPQPAITYPRHRFPAEIIDHAVWLYHVFSSACGTSNRSWRSEACRHYENGVLTRVATWCSPAPPPPTCR
jgi:hypothetical protein